MPNISKLLKNLLISALFIGSALLLSLLMQKFMLNNALISAVYVLAIYLISLTTDGYLYGIISAIIAVLMINYAFTFPYLEFNFTIPENILSAVIMITVTVLTSALTTKLKRQEAVRIEIERERMRGNLLRAVSHDLRTPLTTIIGASSAIIENYASFSDKQKTDMLLDIREDAEWLVRMVENLLSVTKIGSGEVKIVKTPVVLEELIDSILIKFKKRFPHQRIAVDIPEDFITVPVDATLIEQVLINLMENAVLHAHGMTELKMTVHREDMKLYFSIEDDGCGIPQNRLKTIFCGSTPGEHESADARKRNTGIGLSVCATIINAHSGRIFAENKLSGGAKFSFYLLLEDDSDE